MEFTAEEKGLLLHILSNISTPNRATALKVDELYRKVEAYEPNEGRPHGKTES